MPNKPPIALKVLTSILILIISVCVFFIYQTYNYGTIDTYFNSSKSDCYVKLPANMKVVYSNEYKKYAIMITGKYSNRFLWGRRSGWIDESYSVYTNFSDSCAAKSFAVQYLKEKSDEQRKNNYK